jgi:hypothetical protein
MDILSPNKRSHKGFIYIGFFDVFIKLLAEPPLRCREGVVGGTVGSSTLYPLCRGGAIQLFTNKRERPITIVQIYNGSSVG